MWGLTELTKEIRKCLTGAFDLCLFTGRGIRAFDGGWAQALRSFWIPALLLPLALAYNVAHPEISLKGYPALQIVLTNFFLILLSMAAWFALVWVFADKLKAKDKLPVFIAAYNWVGLIMLFPMLPVMAGLVFEWGPEDQLERAMILIQVYAYSVTACIAYRAFSIPWQLAGFLAVVGLFVDDTMRQIIYFVQGIEMVPM